MAHLVSLVPAVARTARVIRYPIAVLARLVTIRMAAVVWHVMVRAHPVSVAQVINASITAVSLHLHCTCDPVGPV